MEKLFATLIKKEHKLGENEYVQGRINGIMEILCNGKRNGIDEPAIAGRRIPGVGELMLTECEPEQYEVFKNLIEKHHPGLCEFDVDIIR